MDDAVRYCGCGDPNVINKECFCPEHQGLFTNMKDLINFIKSCVDETLLNDINTILDLIYVLFIEKINALFNNKDTVEEENKNKNELLNMIDEFILFISNLYQTNLGLFYFVTLKFTENFPFETNHAFITMKKKEK